MAVTATNLIQGAGVLYQAPFGSTEPTDTTVGTAAPSAPWVDCGGTLGGLEIEISQDFAKLEVDQVVGRVGSRKTNEETTLSTSLAEATLENLRFSLNSQGAITQGGKLTTAWKKYTVDNGVATQQPTYSALLFDGWGPNQLNRRVIVRKVLNLDNVSLPYKKDDQTVLSVKFTAHWVSSSIAQVVVVDDQLDT